MSVKMVVFPTLEFGSWIIGMLAIDFDQFVQYSPCKIQIFVSEVLAQN